MSRTERMKRLPLAMFVALALGGSLIAEARTKRTVAPQTVEQRLKDKTPRPDPRDMKTRPMGDWVVVSADHG
jgi:hypothetical protein